MTFKIYQDGAGAVAGDTGGTLEWTEVDQNTIASGSTAPVVVKNGYFSVTLGSLCPLSGSTCQGNTNTGVNFNSDTLWLSTNIAGTAVSNTPTYDGEMLPMKRLAANPYAINSGQLGGLTSGQYVQLGQGIQAATSTTNAAIAINQTGATANILDLQRGGADVQLINNAGQTLFRPTTDSQTALQVQKAGTTTVVFTVDSTNSRIGIGTGAPAYAVDAVGSVNASVSLKVAGTDVCTSSGCVVSGTSVILNQTGAQASSNFNISGTGIAGVSLLTPILDAPTLGGTLAIGPTNATGGLTITPATTINNNVTINGGTSATAFVVNNSTTSTLTVDASANRVTVGTPGNCTGGLGAGKFCVASSGPGSGNTNAQNVLSIANTGAAGLNYGQRIAVNDTSTAKADTNTALVVDNTGTTDTAAITNGILVNNPSGFGGGNLIDLQASSSSIFKVTNGGAINALGTAASQFTTSSGALTITAAAASTFSTTSGTLTLQGGSGTVSLGTSTSLTASGALGISSGGANALTLDTGGAAGITIGGTNATTINIGKTASNTATTINGTTIIKPTTGNDSSTAFQIQNAAGTTLLDVDTTAAKMSIATTTGSLTVGGIANPTIPTLATASTTGTLAANTYYYKLAAQGAANAYTTAISSNPASVTTTGTTSKNTLSWTAVTNATGYIVYRSTNGTTWYTNTVTAATTSLVDNGSTYTWTISAIPNISNYAGGVNLQSGTGLVLDGGTGNSLAAVQYYGANGNNNLDVGNYNTNGAVSISANSFYFQDTTGYNSDLTINNSGQTVFENRVDSTTAFQIQNAESNTLLAASTATDAANLITNPGFESSGTAAWVVKGGAALSRQTTKPYSGQASMRVITTATIGDGVKYPYVLAANTNYVFSVDVYGTTALASMTIGYSADGSTETTYFTTAACLVATWCRYELPVNTPGTVNAGAYFFIKQTDAVAHTMYIDNAFAGLNTLGTVANGLNVLGDYSDARINIGGSSNSTITNVGIGTTTSQAALEIDQQHGQLGLFLKGSGEGFNGNPFDSPPLFEIMNQAGTTALNYAEVLSETTVQGGSAFLGTAAEQVNTLDSGATALRVSGAAGQTADILQVTSATQSTKYLSVGSGGNVTLGTASAATGQLTFANTSNAFTSTIQGNTSASASYTSTLPGAVGSAGQCLTVASVVSTTQTLGYSTCGGATPTLQQAYTASASPANILLTDAKDFSITAASTATDPNILFNLQCVSSCSTNGRFAVQNAGSDVFEVNPDTSVRVGGATNNMSFSATTGEPTLNGTARHTRQIRLSAEYAGATMTAVGGSNTGTMTSDNMTTTPFRNYYKWANTQGTAQNYDIWVKVPIPSDAASSPWPAGQTLCMDTFASATTANGVKLAIYDTSNTVIGTTFDLTPTTANTWQNKCTTSLTAGALAANGTMTVDIKMTAPATTGIIEVGDITFSYYSKW